MPDCFNLTSYVLNRSRDSTSHPQKRLVMKTISMCGYAISWSRCVDLARFAPVSRSRWLAVLRKIAEIAPVDQPVLKHPSSKGAPDASEEANDIQHPAREHASASISRVASVASEARHDTVSHVMHGSFTVSTRPDALKDIGGHPFSPTIPSHDTCQAVC